MARWKLLSSHYLWTDPPTEWQHIETDQMSGRQARKIFEVPRFLDTKDPRDFTDREYGEIHVCDGHNPHPRDVIFKGPPTPEMDPLDDEARRINDSYKVAWKNHPIESLSGEVGASWTDNVMADLQRQVAELQAGRPVVAPVDAAAFVAMQEQVAQLMEANAKLVERLDNPKPPSPNRRM